MDEQLGLYLFWSDNRVVFKTLRFSNRRTKTNEILSWKGFVNSLMFHKCGDYFFLIDQTSGFYETVKFVESVVSLYSTR